MRDVRTTAAIIGLFLSAWSVYLDDVVNTDGVLYLRTAPLLADGNWQAAFSLYKWPLYPLLIALVSLIPGLGVEYSAHVLNAALTALGVVIFLSLVRELGADRKTFIAAAIVILLFPGLNRYRAFVIRDAGYIAFYLLALLLSTGVAARAALLGGSAGGALLTLSALAWWSFGGPQLPTAPEWGALLGNLWHSTTATLSTKIDTIAGALHDRYERAFAYAVLLAALYVVVWEVLVTLTPLYARLGFSDRSTYSLEAAKWSI